MTTSGEQLARRGRDPLARIGLTAKGVLYGVLGLLAIQFARGQASSEEVTQQGAIQKVAEQPFGKFLLVALTIGLICLTLWHVAQAWLGDPIEGDEPKDRVKFGFKALTYAALSFTAAKITIDNWDGGGTEQSAASGNDSSQQAASTLFDLPAGRFLVAIIGLLLIAMAGYQLYKYVVQSEHMERLDSSSSTVENIGRVGYGARAIVLAITGVFFVVAAAQHDPNESKGISGALQELADRDWGRIVLWLVAVGLVLFGVFCLVEAKLRRQT